MSNVTTNNTACTEHALPLAHDVLSHLLQVLNYHRPSTCDVFKADDETGEKMSYAVVWRANCSLMARLCKIAIKMGGPWNPLSDEKAQKLTLAVHGVLVELRDTLIQTEKVYENKLVTHLESAVSKKEDHPGKHILRQWDTIGCDYRAILEKREALEKVLKGLRFQPSPQPSGDDSGGEGGNMRSTFPDPLEHTEWLQCVPDADFADTNFSYSDAIQQSIRWILVVLQDLMELQRVQIDNCPNLKRPLDALDSERVAALWVSGFHSVHEIIRLAVTNMVYLFGFQIDGPPSCPAIKAFRGRISSSKVAQPILGYARHETVTIIPNGWQAVFAEQLAAFYEDCREFLNETDWVLRTSLYYHDSDNALEVVQKSVSVRSAGLKRMQRDLYFFVNEVKKMLLRMESRR